MRGCGIGVPADLPGPGRARQIRKRFASDPGVGRAASAGTLFGMGRVHTSAALASDRGVRTPTRISGGASRASWSARVACCTRARFPARAGVPIFGEYL